MRTLRGVIAAAILLSAATAAASEDFVKAVDKITPSVATVISMSGAEDPGACSSISTGIVISADGLILTSCYVAEKLKTITVQMPGGKTHTGTVRGSDPLSGLTVLKIDAADLTPAEFADSDDLRVGQWVMSVGSQFSADGTSSPDFSVGIIGGLNCALPPAQIWHRHLIKTDAAMTPGCVGGPLIDPQGRVVGINIAICSSTNAWQGVGYAMPTNIAAPLIKKLKAGEKIRHGWMGMHITHGPAVQIVAVAEDGPAAKAGLIAGDTIAAYNTTNINNAYQLIDLVDATTPGSAVRITITRNGKAEKITVTVGSRPVSLPCPQPDPALGKAPGQPDSLYEKIASQLPSELKEKFSETGGNIREAIDKHLAGLKDPALAKKYKDMLDRVRDFDVKVISAKEFEKLEQENRDLKKRIEDLQELLKNK
ncbi:MAG: trypsin-like peptidase domain-containing protein [Planctomycetes bacterium]|nr:trypsin-like peptidase domain-containing protein [Planctomycetota bacterium]